MITYDAHEGIRYAISRVFPEAAWQRCQFHFTRNILEKASQKHQTGLAGELQEMFNCKTIEESRKRRNAIVADYKDVAEEAMNCLDEGFESAMSVMVLPTHLRRYFRTSNQIERLNKELKRRSKVIGVFSNETSLIRLMGSVLVERNEEISLHKRIFTEKSYQELLATDVPAKLVRIALEQRDLQAA